MNETREVDLSVTQGDDWARPLELELSQGDILGTVLVMTIRDGIGGPVLAQISTVGATATGSVTIDDETQATFRLTKEATSSLSSERSYIYDVQATLPSGERKTPVKGRFFVGWQATV